jgi:hypothetical protein
MAQLPPPTNNPDNLIAKPGESVILQVKGYDVCEWAPEPQPCAPTELHLVLDVADTFMGAMHRHLQGVWPPPTGRPAGKVVVETLQVPRYEGENALDAITRFLNTYPQLFDATSGQLQAVTPAEVQDALDRAHSLLTKALRDVERVQRSLIEADKQVLQAAAPQEPRYTDAEVAEAQRLNKIAEGG